MIGVIVGLIASAAPGVVVWLVLFALVVLVGFIRRISTRYTITNQRLRDQRGLLAKHVQQTRIERVQNVNTSQTFVSRVLRVGTVDFDTAGTDELETSPSSGSAARTASSRPSISTARPKRALPPRRPYRVRAPGPVTASGRCFGDGDPLYEAYHDDEWGFPVTDERGLFERLCLEGFQSGLALDHDPAQAPGVPRGVRRLRARCDRLRFDGADVERLMGDAGIVRNRAKIEATIANARATVDLRDGGSPLSELIWAHRPEPRPAPKSPADMPAQLRRRRTGQGAQARRLSLRRTDDGVPAMQACGLVNDHVATCPVRPRAEAAQAAGARR